MTTFSQRYLRPNRLLDDSERLRVRLGAALDWIGLELNERIELRSYLTGQLGIRVKEDLDKLFDRWQVRDVLDAVTLIHGFLIVVDRQRGASGDRRMAALWLKRCKLIFVEEAVHYCIDEQAEVHFAVDEDFARDRAATLANLGKPRYAAARREYEAAFEQLRSDPPSCKAASRGVFTAVETVFKLMFAKAPRLGGAEIRTYLKPAVARAYAEDATALRSANKTAESFANWVDAAHFYRHAQGEEEPSEPPLEITVLLISQGSAFLRWLMTVDAAEMARVSLETVTAAD